MIFEQFLNILTFKTLTTKGTFFIQKKEKGTFSKLINKWVNGFFISKKNALFYETKFYEKVFLKNVFINPISNVVKFSFKKKVSYNTYNFFGLYNKKMK